jgi:hypothetical protein
MSTSVLAMVGSELIGSILWFPVWWYTRGLKLVLEWARNVAREANESYALGVWVKNLFVPMYGDSQWSGRLLSFFVRMGMIVVRGASVLLWCVAAMFGVISYVVALPLAVIGLLFHSVGSLF